MRWVELVNGVLFVFLLGISMVFSVLKLHIVCFYLYCGNRFLVFLEILVCDFFG